MYINKPANAQSRKIYAPGYSSLAMSYYLTNLTLNFVPWLSTDSTGRSEYCKQTHLSTSLNPDGAAFFYLQASRILDGKDSGELVEVVLPCSNGTTLTFEYKPDGNNQMSTFLTINKNNITIPFRFPSIEYQEKVDGQMITKVMQTGLGTFALILGCYLTGTAAVGHYLDKNGEILQWIQEQEQQEMEKEAFAAVGGNNQG